jgi:hypothetical protein
LPMSKLRRRRSRIVAPCPIAWVTIDKPGSRTGAAPSVGYSQTILEYCSNRNISAICAEWSSWNILYWQLRKHRNVCIILVNEIIPGC